MPEPVKGRVSPDDDELAALESALHDMREGRCRVAFAPSGVTCGVPLPCAIHAGYDWNTESNR